MNDATPDKARDDRRLRHRPRSRFRHSTRLPLQMSGEATPTTRIEVARAVARLGRDIRTARLRRGLTQRDLADRMGVSLSSVIRLERGMPGSSMSMYVGALAALDLLEPLAGIADPDLDEEYMWLDSTRRP